MQNNSGGKRHVQSHESKYQAQKRARMKPRIVLPKGFRQDIVLQSTEGLTKWRMIVAVNFPI